jgi:hypothetical protein
VTEKGKDDEETLRKRLTEILFGAGFRQVDDQLVNVSLLERSLHEKCNE